MMVRYQTLTRTLVVAVALTGCTAIATLGQLPTVEHIQQRGEYDCVPAALAMLAHVSYEQASLAVIRVGGYPASGGVNVMQTIAAAATLGVLVRPEYSLSGSLRLGDLESGIAFVRRDNSPLLHAVYVHYGALHDPARPGYEPLSMASGRFPYVIFLLHEL